MTITADALRQAMGCTAARAAEMLPHYVNGAAAANCTTARRAAMFAAQVGHESLGLHYMEEIADGSAYEGRRDLGNTQPGDGRRFKGRGPIQLTGRTNYGSFSRWCRARGDVFTDDHFVQYPSEVAQPPWGFLAASWYWTVARPRILGLCDAGDLVGVTRQVNGGTHGLDDRQARWDRCLRLGDALVPGPASSTPPPTSVGRADASTFPTLREGDTSELVWRLQVFMNKNFGRYSSIDAGTKPPSRLGPQTRGVLEEFQRRSGIPTDPPFGIGRRTWQALIDAGFR